MSTIVFDTLRYANKLKAVGVPEKQAEVQAVTLAEIIEDKLTTKEDLKKLELNLTLKMAELEADLTKEIMKWVLGTAVAQAAVIIACVKLIA